MDSTGCDEAGEQLPHHHHLEHMTQTACTGCMSRELWNNVGMKE